MNKPTLAIIGTGPAGLACGYLLHDRYDLTVYEKNDYIGGHAHTVKIEETDETVFIDTAFVIFSFKNYPHFSRMLRELDVRTIESSMYISFKFIPSLGQYPAACRGKYSRGRLGT